MKLLFFLLRYPRLTVSSEFSRSSRISFPSELASRLFVPVIPGKASFFPSRLEVSFFTRFELPFSTWLEFAFPSGFKFSFPARFEFLSFSGSGSIIVSFSLFLLFSFSLLTLELLIFPVENLVFAELAFQCTIEQRHFLAWFQPDLIETFFSIRVPKPRFLQMRASDVRQSSGTVRAGHWWRYARHKEDSSQ